MNAWARAWGLAAALAPAGLAAVSVSDSQIVVDMSGSSFALGLNTAATVSPPSAPNATLTYDSATSHWVVQLDQGSGPVDYGDLSGTTVAAPSAFGSGLGAYVECTRVFGGALQATMHGEIVNDPATGLTADHLMYRLTLQNLGATPVKVAARLMIDTEVNSNDGANLSIDDGASVVTTDAVYRQVDGDMPGNWWDYDVPPPGVAGLVGRGSLFGNPFDPAATEPDAFEIAYWPYVNGPAQWSLAPAGQAIFDSATVLWWTGSGSENGMLSLAAGAKATFITYYGINHGALLATFTPAVTPSPTPSYSVSPTLTPSPTISPSPTLTPCATVTSTATPSATPTVSRTATPTPTITATFTITPTFTLTPRPLTLTQRSPNPDPATGGATWLPYTLSVDATVTIKVYDVSGELVRRLDPVRQSAGDHEQRWDLRNDAHQGVASGVYIARIVAVDEHGESAGVWEKCSVTR